MTEAVYDIAVVGGGLLGAGIARDAAQRGLSVALYEASDYGAGASASGSRLALGGLSALGTLDFTQVREDIKEREILLQTAPHLVHPQTCLIPFYSHGLLAQARLRAGLALSDALGFDLNFDLNFGFDFNFSDHVPRVHQLLSARAARKRAPALRPGGLLGAALVWEASIPQIERLARELAFDARRHGAALHPHTQVEELCRVPIRQGRERVGGICWKNRLSGTQGRTDAALVILAAGSGQAALSGEAEPLGKTISVEAASITGPALPGLTDVLVFPQEEHPALLLATPRENACWAGSLSTEWSDGNGAAYATGAEVAALVQALQAVLPGLDLAGVSRAQATVQPLTVPGEEVRDLAANGGRCDGLVTVSGTSVTRFRRIAEEAVDLACRKLGRALSVPPCRTASTPLPPVSFSGNPGEVRELVEYAVAEEDCLTLRDFLERRVPPSWTAGERQAKAPDALAALAKRLDWDAGQKAAEIKIWEAELALGQAFRVL